MEKTRFHMLDTLRGVMIIGVVFSHYFIYMASFELQWAESFTQNPIVNIIEITGRILFVLLAGICSHLSRNNLKRGLWVLAASVGISIATLAIDLIMFGKIGYMFIYIGILHLLAVCMIGYALCERLFKGAKRPASWLILTLAGICALLFAVTYNLCFGKIGIGSLSFSVPAVDNIFGTVLGIGFDKSIISADYFPIIPWIFIFICGVCLGVFFKEDSVPQFLHKDICPPVTWIGKKTLLIYLLHPPVVYGIAFLIAYILN